MLLGCQQVQATVEILLESHIPGQILMSRSFWYRDIETQIQGKDVTTLLNLSINDKQQNYNYKCRCNRTADSCSIEVVELGSARGKENAAATLLHLRLHSNRFLSMVLQHGTMPPLVALSQSGTPSAKEKAQALLNQFRSQSHVESLIRANCKESTPGIKEHST
ncbi:hypothetical protein KIW84_062719 [Lathyrus oleraceus]|uniref:Uncharacterized protein n=1 Tax=Pisum sativum TaxID=3888 RepID=A0A9D5A693_PEA|nr:hypothetical protein KIW84_062719 [Pisum sativum]